MHSVIRSAIACVAALFLSSPAASGSDFSVHLFAITSGHYGSAENAGSASLSGAHTSGRLVLQHLSDRLNPRSTILLRSSEDKLVSRNDVFDGLAELQERIDQTPGPDFVVIYLMAHGFGEGIGWNQFLQPGDVGLERLGESMDINAYDPEVLAGQLIYVAEIVDLLKNTGARYMVLVDACYEGSEVPVSSPVFTDAVEQNILDIFGIVRAFNQFRDPDAVIFSAKPGTTVQTVPVPNATGVYRQQKIGPLARRVLLSLEDLPNNGTFSVTDFVALMTDGDLDARTKPAISFYTDEAPITLKQTSQMHDELVVNFGSSSLDDFQVASLEPGGADRRDEVTLPSVVRGHFKLAGSPGEYISDGRDWTYDHVSASFILESLERGRFALTVASGAEDWTIELATPDNKRFEKTRYANTEHPWIKDEGSPGLDISGAGRACNENSGSFVVNDVNYVNDRITSIDVVMTQECLDENIPITGELELLFSE